MVMELHNKIIHVSDSLLCSKAFIYIREIQCECLILASMKKFACSEAYLTRIHTQSIDGFFQHLKKHSVYESIKINDA